MDKNLTISVTKASGLVSSSSMFTGMVIVQDPIYMYLGVIGGVVSLLGMGHELIKIKVRNKYKIVTELVKALLFGVLLTPMIFMLYLKFGFDLFGHILDMEGVDNGMLNSFWFLASILTSWYVLPIWDWVLKFIPLAVKRRLH